MKKADIWALGVTLYCMTYNKMPFSLDGTDLDVMDAICNEKIKYPDEEREAS